MCSSNRKDSTEDFITFRHTNQSGNVERGVIERKQCPSEKNHENSHKHVFVC